MKIILEAFCCTPGTVDSCAERLAEGKILGLAPGGVYEAQFGDHRYKLLWRERLGFAKAALKANVPILPVFTENIRYAHGSKYSLLTVVNLDIRESFRVLPVGNSFFYWLFEKTRLPLRPVFGGFPVKLRTHIGEPIYPEPDMSPERMRDLCKVKWERFSSRVEIHSTISGVVRKNNCTASKNSWKHSKRHF